MLNEFKKEKKEVELKLKQINKMMNDMQNNFVSALKEIVSNSTIEDLEEFLNSDEVDVRDKKLVLKVFSLEHDVDIIGITLDKDDAKDFFKMS